MSSFSRSLFAQPEAEPQALENQPAATLDSLFGKVEDMDPAWSEGSDIFHTKARCTRFQAIDTKNRRSQKTEPTGKTLCYICEKITRNGRKG